MRRWARQLARRGVDIEVIKARRWRFGVAIPTWGVGTRRHALCPFPGPGEPRDIFDKLDDCATIQQLVRATPTVSPHFPWDTTSDYAALREAAAARGLAFDAVNSNTFQDQPGQKLSYKFGIALAMSIRACAPRRSPTTSSASRSAASSAPRR